MRSRFKEKLALWGGTVVLAAAILGTIAARPFRRVARRAHSARSGSAHAGSSLPPPADPPPDQVR